MVSDKPYAVSDKKEGDPAVILFWCLLNTNGASEYADERSAQLLLFHNLANTYRALAVNSFDEIYAGGVRRQVYHGRLARHLPCLQPLTLHVVQLNLRFRCQYSIVHTQLYIDFVIGRVRINIHRNVHQVVLNSCHGKVQGHH